MIKFQDLAFQINVLRTFLKLLKKLAMSKIHEGPE